MISRRDLYERIFRAEPRYETVQAELRRWTKQPLWMQAAEAWKLRRGGGAWTANTVSDEESKNEELTKLWAKPPTRMRTETSHAVNVRDGSRFLQITEDRGAQVHDVGHNVYHRDDLGLLDPAVAVRQLDLELLATIEHIGREAVHARAVPVPQEYPWNQRPGVYGIGADHLDLIIDVERGIVLKATAYFEGQPFEVNEVLSITFDEPLDDKLFAIESGDPDEPVVEAPKPQRSFVHEVSAAAGFTIYVPPRIDAVDVPDITIFPSRAGDPPMVHLNYKLRDDSRSYAEGDILYLMQRPVSASDNQMGGCNDEGDWRPVDEFTGREQGGRRRLRLERDGILIDIESAPMLTPERLEAEPMSFGELAEIARSLVPAPTELPPLQRRVTTP